MLHGRTENNVKNRFKHILKKFCDNKYGKAYYPKYQKKRAKITEDSEANLPRDEIVEEMLMVKKQELNTTNIQMQGYDPLFSMFNNQVNMMNSYQSPYYVQSSAFNKPQQSTNMVSKNSAFNKLQKNTSMMSRNNVSKLGKINSQPFSMNYNMGEMWPDFNNLNNESLNLNSSMKSDGNWSYDVQASSMYKNNIQSGYNEGIWNQTNFGSNGHNSIMNGINASGQVEDPNVHMNTSHVPTASINLMPDDNKMEEEPQKQNEGIMGQKIVQNEADANMEPMLNPNLNLPLLYNIDTIKKNYIRKFIDSENEENFYVLNDGKMYVECIRTGQVKPVSQGVDIIHPINNQVYAPNLQIPQSNHPFSSTRFSTITIR